MKADFEIKRLEGRRRWKRRAAYAVRVTAGSDAAAAAFARRLAFGGLNGRRVLGRLRPRDQLPQTGLRGRQRAPEPRPGAGGAGVRPEDRSPPSPRKDADPGGAGPRLWPRLTCRHPDSRWGQGLEQTQREGPPWRPGPTKRPRGRKTGKGRGLSAGPAATSATRQRPAVPKLGRSALRPRPAPLGPGGPRRGETAQGWPAPAEPSWKGAGRWSQRRDGLGGGEGTPTGGETREAARAERSAVDRAGKDCQMRTRSRPRQPPGHRAGPEKPASEARTLRGSAFHVLGGTTLWRRGSAQCRGGWGGWGERSRGTDRKGAPQGGPCGDGAALPPARRPAQDPHGGKRLRTGHTQVPPGARTALWFRKA